MLRLTTILVLFVLANSFVQPALAEDKAETRYLAFQLMTGLPGYAGPPPLPGRLALSKSQLESFVRDVIKTIGTTGDARHKLAFAVGPLNLDMSEEETRQFIRDAFAVALENDIAIAFHIDDSMGWGQRKDLLSNPDNLETAGWNGKPNTGRRADWGPTPTKFPPQICFNSPAVVAAVKERAVQIGSEIQQELNRLTLQNKQHLLAAVIAGWETLIGSDFETGRPLGYRALEHRGFSASKPPSDMDLERVSIVKEFIELWTNSLRESGVPQEALYCHIAFTDQGLRKADAKETYAEKLHFALPEVAFSSAYRPGFSTYPEGATLKKVQALVTAHGSPRWISAEGTNVSPTSMPGEATMETYLARMFNHGAVLVNVFSWGIGGERMRDNFFRKATENPEAIAAYGKFLRSEPLVESSATGFSSDDFRNKMQRLQQSLPGWIQKSGRHEQAVPLTKKLDTLLKDKKWQEADQVVDQLLAMMKADAQNSTDADLQTNSKPIGERLPPKIKRIQAELPKWVQKTGRQNDAQTLMKKLDEFLKSKNFEEADQTADTILKLIENTQPAPEKDENEEARMRLRHELGGSFLVSRANVQDELKMTNDQKSKVDQFLKAFMPEAQQVLKSATGSTPGERQQTVRQFRQQSNQKLDDALKTILDDAQRARLRQLVLQREGLFGDGRLLDELRITDEQRQQFKEKIQQADSDIKAAHASGVPTEIRPKALKIRIELQSSLESILTESQLASWKEMRGSLFPYETLFD